VYTSAWPRVGRCNVSCGDSMLSECSRNIYSGSQVAIAVRLAMGARSLAPGSTAEQHKALLNPLSLHLLNVCTVMCCRDSVSVPRTCNPHRVRSSPVGPHLMPSPLASIAEDPDEHEHARNVAILAAGTS